MSTDRPQSTPDEESLAMLLEEVAAMAAAKRPLVSGLENLDDASMGKVGRAANVVRVGLAQGKSTAESIAAVAGGYRSPVRLAMEVMAITGSTEPIEEAARLIRQTSEDRRRMVLAAINPILNVIVGATILFFVMPWILVSLAQAEFIEPAFAPSITEICQAFAQDFMLATIATVVVVGLLSWGLAWGLSQSRRNGDVFRDHATFCRWLAIQINPARGTPGSTTGIELGRVLQAAAEAVGPAWSSSWASVIDNVHGGSTSEDALEMPPHTPEPVRQCVLDLVNGRRPSDRIALDLRRLAELYLQKSNRDRSLWTEVLPRAVTWLLMILMMVILLQAILMPLLQVVGEVAQ
ncbi:type II secretion system F family protein [Rhodopirellula sp. JC639]|uniref:type II secretion system F family protein n=1 Tax=Stieleria mannarensis TaxID=2755585 RepID=UPI0015FF2338|nr:type II secretion system F family protein [Rhodopirellula sp. JC639]